MLSPKEHKRLEKYIHGIDVSHITTAFDALGEPNRCLIFRALLRERAVNVGQLASAVGISESLASQHLKVLAGAGLVVKNKDGQKAYYAVNAQEPLVDALRKAVMV
jgi:DNA-binding transcriptional ArsR family regulator